jgi:hypothetical protein
MLPKKHCNHTKHSEHSSPNKDSTHMARLHESVLAQAHQHICSRNAYVNTNAQHTHTDSHTHSHTPESAPETEYRTRGHCSLAGTHTSAALSSRTCPTHNPSHSRTLAPQTIQAHNHTVSSHSGLQQTRHITAHMTRLLLPRKGMLTTHTCRPVLVARSPVPSHRRPVFHNHKPIRAAY